MFNHLIYNYSLSEYIMRIQETLSTSDLIITAIVIMITPVAAYKIYSKHNYLSKGASICTIVGFVILFTIFIGVFYITNPTLVMFPFVVLSILLGIKAQKLISHHEKTKTPTGNNLRMVLTTMLTLLVIIMCYGTIGLTVREEHFLKRMREDHTRQTWVNPMGQTTMRTFRNSAWSITVW